MRLRTFPACSPGVGEFTIHKEFVSAKVAGNGASLNNPALDRISILPPKPVCW